MMPSPGRLAIASRQRDCCAASPVMETVTYELMSIAEKRKRSEALGVRTRAELVIVTTDENFQRFNA